MKNEIMMFAVRHPFITAGIGLTCAFGAYKLADKIIDAVSLTANHAIDAGYSFEKSEGTIKTYPRLQQQPIPQHLPATE